MIGFGWLSAAEIFVDSKTKLVWQNNGDTKNIKRDWNGAMSYCQSLTLGGYDDWRLPNIRELESIVDITKYNPAIKSGFEYVVSLRYWSSSITISNSKRARNVIFEDGSSSNYPKTHESNVRCVRGRQ